MFLINDIIVLDNFMPPQYEDLVEKELLNPIVNWHYMKDITYEIQHAKDLGLTEFRPAFAHKFYDRANGIVSPAYGLITPIVYLACDKIGYKFNEIIAARSFLTLPLPGLSSNLDHPHVDREVSHLVVLYYVTDADGDTVFFDKTFRDVDPSNVKIEDLRIIKSVSPKKGRAVLFDGSRYHTSTRPTKGHRVIINFGLW